MAPASLLIGPLLRLGRSRAAVIPFKPAVRWLWTGAGNSPLCAKAQRHRKGDAPTCGGDSDEAAKRVAAMVDEAALDSLARCQMEFHSGTNGYEAMLFAVQLMQAYEKFAKRRGWSWDALELSPVEEGIRHATISISGPHCYSTLRFEAGTHRLVPVDIRREADRDRMRTPVSTVNVVVMPELENPELELSSHDVKREIMRSSGAGGANVNSKSTAVRLTHQPTGVSVKCQESRYLMENEKLAYRRLGALLLQRELDKVSAVKMHFSVLARSTDRVRSYHPRDKWVTDHRLRFTINGVLDDYLQGGPSMERMIDAVQETRLCERAEEGVEGD